MKGKWANYLISQVKYNDQHTHIINVVVHEDLGNAVGDAVLQPRQWVISMIDNDYSFCTALQNNHGKWVRGRIVVADRVMGNDYLTTLADGQAIDNLENLPEYF
ncbi:DUF3892 domain-containing protein [Rahnella victoriana]|uniref:DUF3892 domain-containing protein n=1 Tax=Rahnella victoriana TaxID=1510570 RepID=UPI000BB1D320|nr:DUF3892 domain-containing protein [Rahnella victoriana]PBI79249.1 hypothetical protein A9993_05670 [Rahnella victoriana]TBX32088.1 DUF3892 domain-containing protein [Rahnella victoriana]